jgi:hypothetical protein
MGEWKEAEISYLKANRTSCDLCGRLVAGRYWAADVGGAEKVFCDPAHERKYHEYWLPRYGTGGAA